MLPCREIAAIMETDKRQVSIWRSMAIEDGYLMLVKAHKFVSGRKGEATEFARRDSAASICLWAARAALEPRQLELPPGWRLAEGSLLGVGGVLARAHG
jgi:uncharacterized protein YbdZ (MbtH family)